jgi:hypothetical protein
MAVFNGAFPILPGKEQVGRDFAAACMGERRKEFDTHLQARSQITRETWALQETPMGSFMLVWFEAPDIEKAFTDLASGDEFSTWFRGQVKDVTGVDLGAPPESPPPDVLVDWTA